MGPTIIISATNRPNSNTMKVSRIYADILGAKNEECKILDLGLLPENFVFTESHGKRTEAFEKIVNDYVLTATKFILVVPEYNGSFPGILKSFIDSVQPKDWANKYVCLVGVSVGRAGNLRGLDHLTGILGYLKMHVFYNKLPISVVDKLLDENEKFKTAEQLNVCTSQVEGFLSWAE